MDETIAVISKIVEAQTGFVISDENMAKAEAAWVSGNDLANSLDTAEFLLPPIDSPAFDRAVDRVSVYLGIRSQQSESGWRKMATRAADTFERAFEPEWLDDDQQPIDACDFNFDAPGHSEFQLWTCVDPMVASGMHYWIPGFHRVNRVGYIWTKNPWSALNAHDEYRRW